MKLRYRGAIGARRRAVLLAVAPARRAQSGTIRFVIGTAPGGAIDPYARLVADPMSKALGQTIIVEYKPGANGNISAQFIADQPADGQHDLDRHPGVHRDQSQRVQEPALVDRRFHRRSSAASRHRWCSSRIRACRPRPSRSSSPGPRPTAASSATRPTARHAVALPRLSAEREVRSRSHPCALSRLGPAGHGAGRRPFAVRLRAGQHDGAAASGRQAQGARHHRSERATRSLPDVPTFAELGYPEFTAKVWFGLLVKKGTPADIVKRYTDAAKAAHADPDGAQPSSKRRASMSSPKPGRSFCPTSRSRSSAGASWSKAVGLLRRGPRQHR